jgi:predicted transcriptional regulator
MFNIKTFKELHDQPHLIREAFFQVMTRAGLTVSEVSRQTGITTVTLHNFMTERKKAQLKTMSKLLHWMETNYGERIDGL